MKNKSKWAALLAVLLIAALLTGCSLAREDGTVAAQDELIGVMVRYRPNGEDDHFYEYDRRFLHRRSGDLAQRAAAVTLRARGHPRARRERPVHLR